MVDKVGIEISEVELWKGSLFEQKTIKKWCRTKIKLFHSNKN